MNSYEEFLRNKIAASPEQGIPVQPMEISPVLFPHQRDIVLWAIRKGRAAIFAAFGLGKTLMQLEIARQILSRTLGSFLIVTPLGIWQEFKRDAKLLGMPLEVIRKTDDLAGPGLYLTNYESVREGKIDVNKFDGASLDEAGVLRGFGGTKTFREFMRLFEGNDRLKYRFVATATPSPNEYIELLAYSAFLEVMDVGQAKTRFFKRDSTKADALTIHPHKEREFWLWLSTWAIFLQKPSDLGYSDEGYSLPEMDIRWHEVPSDHSDCGYERGGQKKLLNNAAIGVQDAAHEKRTSLNRRIERMVQIVEQRVVSRVLPSEQGPLPGMEQELLSKEQEQSRGAERSLEEGESRKISRSGKASCASEPGNGSRQRASLPGMQCSSRSLSGQPRDFSPSHKIFDQFIVWCDLNAEQQSIDHMLHEHGISFSSLYGNQPIEEREILLEDWREGKTTAFISKPMMYGSGVNLQQCHIAIFLGIGFKFADFRQAIARIHRFLQLRPVEIHIIYTEAEREIRRALEEKWANHERLTEQMSAIIRKYGLATNALHSELHRSFDVEREEASGESYQLICGDSVIVTPKLAADSAGLILTSIPFSTQYEYTPSYRDFGHTDSNEHFFEQMDYLTPALLRVLKPGRVAAIHVKDRVVPGGMTGLGFQTVWPFHAECIRHYVRHGFAYLGMKTIVTDVVRENNQTYRLGWTEQCKDGSRMGVGMPEYLLLFRKPPTDSSNGYADEPVVKDKAEYSRSRWQIDAHGFMRSSGNRLLCAEDLSGIPHERIFKLFRCHSLETVYDFEHHVKLGEALEAKGLLPVTFMLLQPQSWSPEVWTDITRMLSLNSAQSAAGREMHLCPMQFDLADRVIAQFSMPGETVFDPFMGLGTVPLRAVKLGRRGLGVELSPSYFADAVLYLEAAERDRLTPDLFALIEPESAAAAVP